MKREAITHTKMKRLCRGLDMPLWQAVGLMESIWHLTAREAPRGDLGKLSDADIALALDYRGDEAKLIEALCAGWLDRHDTHRLVVHDWSEHADDAIQMKLARSRLFFADGRAPRLSRLGSRERDAAIEFYSKAIAPVCAQTTDPCAQNSDPCTQMRTPCALPEPEPEPEPRTHTPLPVIGNRAGTPPAGGVRVPPENFLGHDLAERIYTAHPNKAGKVMFEQALSEKLARAPDPKTLAARIEQTHAAWLPVWQERLRRSVSAPRLDRWIRDDLFLDSPPQREEPAADELKTYDDFVREELSA